MGTNSHQVGGIEFMAADGDTRFYGVHQAKGLEDGKFHPERLFVECDYRQFVELMVNAGWLPVKNDEGDN